MEPNEVGGRVEGIRRFFRQVKEKWDLLYFLNFELSGVNSLSNKDTCWYCHDHANPNTMGQWWVSFPSGTCGKKCRGHGFNVCKRCGNHSTTKCFWYREE